MVHALLLIVAEQGPDSELILLCLGEDAQPAALSVLGRGRALPLDGYLW